MQINIEQNISLKEFTTFRVGGPVRYFAKAKNWETIYGLREFAKKQGVPYLILGGGSNVIFTDDGYPGLVILNQMDKIQFHGDSVTAEGAVTWTKLIASATELNLGGISGFSNVPGTVGGAVYGNAGIPDMCMADIFMTATILPTNGHQPIIVGPEYGQFGYRASHFKQTKDIVLSVTLQLRSMPAPFIKQEVTNYIKTRIMKQPPGLTCGSFFKNPSHFPSAGWLIEQAGCKGMTEGEAFVSDKHANFFLNKGKATASDVLNLALKVHQKVKEKFDINLEPEVQIYPQNPFSRSLANF